MSSKAMRWSGSELQTQEAKKVLETLLEPDDVVLIKGSRGMRMDAIVTALENGL